MTRATPGTVICPILIGRRHDLATLLELLERKRGAEGQAILISGEAGIGKSRLVAEARSHAARVGFLLLEGQCFERDRSIPYAPLLELFRAYLARFSPDDLPDHLRAFVSLLAPLLPDLGLLFPALANCSPPPVGGPEEEKRRLFASMTHCLTEQAGQTPVLLVVEDVHWGDDLSLDFLLHLARRTRRLPLVLLFTTRNDVYHPGLQQWLAQLDRERLAHEVTLEPLSRSEIDDMAHAILGPERAISADLMDTLAALSEGNPFFVEELLKSLMMAGKPGYMDGKEAIWSDASAAVDSAIIPRSVQVAVQQQVDRLSAAAQQALTLAAIAGRRFDFPVLRAALRCDETSLLSRMKELLAAQLVVEVSADQFAFRHMLIQQAIYSGLLTRERQTLHRTLAETLEQMATTPALRERFLGDLAIHCSEAGMWEQSLVYEQQIAERALALYAPHAAIGHLTRALAAAERLSVAPLGTLYYTRGRAFETVGAFDQAQSDYQRALKLAQTAGDGSLEWQVLLAFGSLWTERDYTQAGAWFLQARALAERLADPLLQARSFNRIGNWLVNTGRVEEGLHAHQIALKMFEEQHDTQGMAETLDLLGTAYGMRGDRINAVEQLGQAITLLRALGDTPSLISSLAMRAVQSMPGSSETSLCPLRGRNACAQDATEALQLARQSESPARQAFAGNALSHTLLAFGEFGPALAQAHEARRIATEIAHQQWMVATTFALGQCYVLLLAPALAQPLIEEGMALAHRFGSTFWQGSLVALQGRAHMLNHDLSAAQAALHTAMAPDQPPNTMIERQLALVWGELRLAQGKFALALDTAEHLLATVSGQDDDQPSQPIPHVLKLRGEALLGLSRVDEAAACLEEARRGAVQRGALPVLWTIHRALGQAYRRLRRADDAAREYAAGRLLVRQLATSIEEPLLRNHFLQTALGSFPKEQPLPPRKAARRAFGGLTAREHEVAVLIAQGKTSREIADALVMSERTAEGHVSNILGKLGFSSRAQIAAWIVERGLAGA